MASRNSNNYKICIVPESSYGTINKTLTTAGGAKFFDNILNWDRVPITAERVEKENSLYKSPSRTVVTGEMLTGTISGDLTSGHEILLQGIFDDDASPYLFAAAMPTQNTYNIYQLFLDSTGACTSYDVLVGCSISPLSLTGESNGIWQFSAAIEASGYLQEQANSSGTALTLQSGLPVTGAPFLFGDTTFIGYATEETATSISIELAKTYVDNALRFANSLNKTNDRYTQAGGTLSYTTEWDSATHSYDKSNIYDQTPYEVAVSLNNATHTWEFVMYGVVTQAQRPDADRGYFMGNYTLELTSGTGLVPVTVTVL